MNQPDSKDKIYAEPLPAVRQFRFDEQVASVFPDMIKRSVPGYQSIIEGISVIAGAYVQKESHCYDLGCSLGAAALAIQQGIRQPDCKIFAADNSIAMLNKAEKLFEHQVGSVDLTPVSLVESDILDMPIIAASLAVLNFTLQFIPLQQRDLLLARIAKNMLPGGAVILSEKICFDDPAQNEMFTRLHHEFKRAQGYSQLEISQKRSALEDVLVPETLDTHINRLLTAGFSYVYPWFQQLNFVSLLAVR